MSGVATDVGDVAVTCAVVPAAATLTSRDVRAWVRRNVADYAVPRHVDVVDALPLTPLGKLDRRALIAAALGRLKDDMSAAAEPGSQGAAPAASRRPRNSAEAPR